MNEQRRMRNRVRAADVAIFILSILALRAQAPAAQVEDCVAAVVNGRAVTLVDVRIAQRFGLHAGDPGEASRSAVLDRLIEQKLVFDLARGPAAPTGQEIEAAAEETAGRLGPDAWARALAEFGITEADLRPFIEETVGYRKALAARFSQAAPVTIREIEAYYRDVYVPERTAAGETPAPMVQVLDRIESRIQEEKRDKLVADWIGNLRSQAEIRVNRACLE
jgi:hypothetical protein